MNDYAKNDVMLSEVNYEPSIIFCDETSQEVGKLFWDADGLHFTGEVDESAKIFIDFLTKRWPMKGETK